MRQILTISTVLICMILSACSQYSVKNRQQNASDLVIAANWESKIVQTPLFPIQAYIPKPQPVTVLTIYIEGDGLAWISRNKPSMDPTPIHPLGLELALADTINDAAYLARPCQFVKNDTCKQHYWTDGRFSQEVIDSMNAAVSNLKTTFEAQKIRLVGYSGGGAIATLLAAKREDVIQLITVAGNLDHVAWTNLHNISPLTSSLNPADAWPLLVNVPQVHFVGSDDLIVPYAVADSFMNRFPTGLKPRVEIIESANHSCCWLEQWPYLLSTIAESP